MSDYYKEQRMAFINLADRIEIAKEKNEDIDLNTLLVRMTDSFLIGERCILNRIERIQKIRGDFEIKNDMIHWNNIGVKKK